MRKTSKRQGIAPGLFGYRGPSGWYRAVGTGQTLVRCNGMFALALWDREAKALMLAGDRMGEKPLYYGWMGKQFLFGSELKALRAIRFQSIPWTVLPTALLLRHNCIPGPYSICEGIAKLPPARWVDALRRGSRNICRHAYWSLNSGVGWAWHHSRTASRGRRGIRRIGFAFPPGRIVADMPVRLSYRRH
ncbi:MAG: hypothetical protein U0231_14590 [Nitrospiraceae bacterium]